MVTYSRMRVRCGAFNCTYTCERRCLKRHILNKHKHISLYLHQNIVDQCSKSWCTPLKYREEKHDLKNKNQTSELPYYDLITDITEIQLENDINGSKMVSSAEDSDCNMFNKPSMSPLKTYKISTMHEQDMCNSATVQSYPRQKKSQDPVTYENDIAEANITTPLSSPDKDEFDLFGTYVALTMRNMSAHSALLLKNKINLLFYEENLNVSPESPVESSMAVACPTARNTMTPALDDDKTGLMPSSSKPHIQSENEESRINREYESTKKICMPIYDAEDECDIFFKSISTQMKTLPIINKVQLYADIQNVVVQNRVKFLQASKENH